MTRLYEPGDLIPGPDLYVVKRLGAGGQAEVYLAWSDFAQARRVIKLLNPDHLGQEGEKLFRKEVRLMVRLVHPHIVRVLDGQWTREAVPRPYYVMDEESGSVPVAELIAKKTPFSLTQILRIVYEVADALDYVHNLTDEHGEPLGAVHRDIKPANLLLAKSGNGSVVKLLDFGIARALRRVLDGARETMFLGTFAYSAPEQVEGNAVPQSDIYSLGVVLYELLAGRHPYWDAQDLHDMVACHRFITPRPISSYRANVPDRVTALTMSCLQKDPASRPASARALRDELRRCMDEAAVLARRERERPVSDHDTTDEMPVEKLLDQRRAQLDALVNKTVAIIEERTGAGASAAWFQTDPGGAPVARGSSVDLAPASSGAETPFAPSPSFDAWRAPTEPSTAPPQRAASPRAPAVITQNGDAGQQRAAAHDPGPTRASAAAYHAPGLRNAATPTPAPTHGAPVARAPAVIGAPLLVPPVHAGQTDPDPPRDEIESSHREGLPTASAVARFRNAETQEAAIAPPPPTERLDARGATVPFGPALAVPKAGKGSTVPMAPSFRERSRPATSSLTMGKAVILLVGVTFLLLTVGLLVLRQRRSEPAPAATLPPTPATATTVTGPATTSAAVEDVPKSAPLAAAPPAPNVSSVAATSKPTTSAAKMPHTAKPRGESPQVGP